MTLRELFEAGTNLCGFESADHAPEAVRAEVFRCISSALQLIQSAGEEYYGRETLSLALGSGATSVNLPENVQSVLSPVRLSGSKALRQLASRAEYDLFTSIYLAGGSSATPLAYFVDTGKNTANTLPTGNMIVSGAGQTFWNGVYVLAGTYLSRPCYYRNTIPLIWNGTRWFINSSSNGYYSTSDVSTPDLAANWQTGFSPGVAPAPTVTAEMTAGPTDDSAKTTLRITPAAGAASPNLLVDVILEAPSYTRANLCDDTTPPIPHKYHESILAPLVRYNVTGTKYFRQPERSALMAQIEADYARALQMLGLGNPDRSKAGGQIPPPQRTEQQAK